MTPIKEKPKKIYNNLWEFYYPVSRFENTCNAMITRPTSHRLHMTQLCDLLKYEPHVTWSRTPTLTSSSSTKSLTSFKSLLTTKSLPARKSLLSNRNRYSIMSRPTYGLPPVVVMAVVETKNVSSSPEANNLLEAIMKCMNWQDTWTTGRSKFNSLVEKDVSFYFPTLKQYEK